MLMARKECVLGWKENPLPNVFMTAAITTGPPKVRQWFYDNR